MDKNLILKYLKDNLSEYRLNHTMRVKDMALKLGSLYDADVDKIEIAALLHDCAKDFNKDELIRISKENDLISKIDYCFYGIIHANVGAFIAREKFNIRDEEILNAIEFHTTGRPSMSLSEKIIFVSDKVEEGRVFEGAVELRDMAFKDLEETIIMYFDMEIVRLVKKRRCIHPKSIECRNFYIGLRGESI